MAHSYDDEPCDERGAAAVAIVDNRGSAGLRSTTLDRFKEEVFTEIPAAFLIARSPHTSPETEGRASRQSQLRESMRNDAYEKRMMQSPTGRKAARYHVPVNRPLPLRSAEPAAGRRHHEGGSDSALAALFSRENDATEEGRAKLGFLAPQTERRHEIEERHQKNIRARPDPKARKDANEPAKMPKLDKKVPKGFVPQCAEMATKASTARVEERKRK